MAATTDADLNTIYAEIKASAVDRRDKAIAEAEREKQIVDRLDKALAEVQREKQIVDRDFEAVEAEVRKREQSRQDEEKRAAAEQERLQHEKNYEIQELEKKYVALERELLKKQAKGKQTRQNCREADDKRKQHAKLERDHRMKRFHEKLKTAGNLTLDGSARELPIESPVRITLISSRLASSSV